MFRLGQAYLACGEQTAKVELILRRIASAYGMRRSRVVAFPTAIFISLHDGAEERVTLAEGPTQTLRLDQIADVYTLGDAAQRGEVPPARRSGATHRDPAQDAAVRRRWASSSATSILSVGVAMVLMPTLDESRRRGAARRDRGRGEGVQSRPAGARRAAAGGRGGARLGARLPGDEARAAGRPAARARAAAGDVPARRDADARHGRAGLRRHGERFEPA